ncbi:hypothetical protein [Streptomyces sp. NPDC058401]|uniref:hypothetical protein n=1 Tax=Streptomyces sp. NPDC058401 TaxID=3346480 RepID=UPI003654A89F
MGQYDTDGERTSELVTVLSFQAQTEAVYNAQAPYDELDRIASGELRPDELQDEEGNWLTPEQIRDKQSKAREERDALRWQQLTGAGLAATMPVRISREGMTYERRAGYWHRWTEAAREGNTRHLSNWINASEYLVPGQGVVEEGVGLVVLARWEYGPGDVSDTVTYPVVFEPGQTVQSVVIDRIQPDRPATLRLDLRDPYWTGKDGGQRFMMGIEGPTSNGALTDGFVHRSAVYTTDQLPAVPA